MWFLATAKFSQSSGHKTTENCGSWPFSEKVVMSTVGWIYAIHSYMELSGPVVMQHYCHFIFTLEIQGQIMKNLYRRNGRVDWHFTKGCELIECWTHVVTFNVHITHDLDLRSGMADWHGTKGMWVYRMLDPCCDFQLEWVGLWGFLWWAPLAKRKDHHRVSSGWSSTWFHSNTGLSSTQYEQIPIIFGVWPFWLTPFFFRLISPCGLGDPRV